MSTPTILMNKLFVDGFAESVIFNGEDSERHFDKAGCIMQSSGTTLTSEKIAIVMTPYSVDEDPEFYYQFEIASLNEDAPVFEASMYYAEQEIDWQKDVESVKTFTVHSRQNAQAVFGFLCSQFFY